jgi:hypothetical protein
LIFKSPARTCRVSRVITLSKYELVHFDVEVNVADELEARVVAHGAEHQAEYVAREDGVAEELQRLQAARHVAPLYVEEYGIDQNKNSRRSRK